MIGLCQLSTLLLIIGMEAMLMVRRVGRTIRDHPFPNPYKSVSPLRKKDPNLENQRKERKYKREEAKEIHGEPLRSSRPQIHLET
jgi:hypothetical protein